MGIRHRELPAEGVQFHPESVLTEHGQALLSNFLAGDAAEPGPCPPTSPGDRRRGVGPRPERRARPRTCCATIMEGEASEVEIAGLLSACGPRARPPRSSPGLARTMRSLATPVPAGRDDLIDTAGTGRRAPDLQRVHHRRPDRRRRRLRGGQARQPLGHQPIGSADVLEALGARIDLGPEAVADCIDDVGLRLHVRSRPPPGHALRRAGAQGAGRAHDLQLPRPADQPGRRQAPAHRRLRPRLPGRIAGALRAAGCVQRALVVSSDDGLDEMSTAGPTQVVEVDRPDGADAAASSAGHVEPGDVGLAPRRPGELRPVARPRRTRRSRAAILAGEPGPRRDLAVLNAGGAIYVAGRATRSRPACARREAAIDDGRAAAGAGAPARDARRKPGAGMNVLDRIVDVHPPGRSSSRRRERPLAELERELAGARRGPSVLGGARAARHLADRRVQAPLALAGAAPGGRRSPRWSAPTSAAARRRCRSSPSATTSAARSTICARPAAPATCRSCARTSSLDRYQLYESAAAGADAVLLIVAALEPRPAGPPAREARALDLDVLVEVHDERELDAALEVDAEIIGINNRDLTDFSRRRASEPTSCSPTSRRARSSSPSRASARASRSTRWIGSAWTRCWWASR